MTATPRLPLILVVVAVVLIGCGGGGGGSPSRTGGPTMTISMSPRAVLGGNTTTAIITFSEKVTGFTVGDVMVGGGTAGTFTAVNARTYHLMITADGEGAMTVDVDVAAGVCVDAAGNAVVQPASAQAAIAHAPWASATGTDSHGVWANLTVTGNGETAMQRFRLIAPGTFTMGSPPDEEGRNLGSSGEYESQHQVTLTTPFWIADSECTQRLWKAVTGVTPSYYRPPLVTENLDLPVEQVSHTAVVAFMGTLNTITTNLAARLPTESEWEYVARAGTTTPFSLDQISSGTINCAVAVPDPYIATGNHRSQTVPVKSLPPNAWGLHEVHGNVWEWCADGWQSDWGSAPVVDPSGPIGSSLRVLRGGGRLDRGRDTRSAVRIGAHPDTSWHDRGFRIVAPNQPSGGG